MCKAEKESIKETFVCSRSPFLAVVCFVLSISHIRIAFQRRSKFREPKPSQETDIILTMSGSRGDGSRIRVSGYLSDARIR
jgi:hypothetical protein